MATDPFRPPTSTATVQFGHTTRNRLLAALPQDEYERLLPALQTVSASPKDVLQDQGEPIRRVYFPAHGVCSLVCEMQDGIGIEVGIIGPEGMTGISVMSDWPTGPYEIRVQIPDDAMQVMDFHTFGAELNRDGHFAHLVHRYEQVFLRLVMQSCACNGLHKVVERCCRWLLMVHDRIGRDELPVTHDAVASALGVRRPTLTLAVNALRRAGLISHRHRKIRILNRSGLELAACECYQVGRRQLRRLLAS